MSRTGTDTDEDLVGAMIGALGALDRENRRFRARYATEFGFGPPAPAPPCSTGWRSPGTCDVCRTPRTAAASACT